MTVLNRHTTIYTWVKIEPKEYDNRMGSRGSFLVVKYMAPRGGGGWRLSCKIEWSCTSAPLIRVVRN
jgi:hypothetical protein